MTQDITEEQEAAVTAAWEMDISVGGAPEGWTLESFKAKIRDKMYNGQSFREAYMRTLFEVPRPDDKRSTEEKLAKLKAMVAKLKEIQLNKFKETK